MSIKVIIEVDADMSPYISNTPLDFAVRVEPSKMMTLKPREGKGEVMSCVVVPLVDDDTSASDADAMLPSAKPAEMTLNDLHTIY